MDLNTPIKQALKDPRVVALVDELVPNIFQYRELKLFWNKPLKFILGKGKYINIDNKRLEKLLEDIIQAPLPKVEQNFKVKKINRLNLKQFVPKSFLTYNETTIPMSILAAQKGEEAIQLQALKEYIPLVWDKDNKDHKLNYQNHFISWKAFKINSYDINSKDDFLKTIIYNIQHNCYIYLFINERYVEQSRRFNMDFDHDYCITGYDLKTNKLSLMGYTKRNFTCFESSIDIIQEAFFNQVNPSPFIISVKPKSFFKSISKKNILSEIYDYFTTIDPLKGINIYNKILEEINENIIDYRYYSLLNDHSNLIAHALRKFVSPSFAQTYEEKICNNIKNIFTYSLMIKERKNINLSQINKIKESVLDIYENEKKFALDIMNNNKFIKN